MNKDEKKSFVSYLHDRFQKVVTTIVADYRGLNVELMTQLRKEMREAGVEFRVVKNTLTRLASKGTAMEPMMPLLEGPTAIAMHDVDPVAPARILVDFRKNRDLPVIKGGVIEGKLLSPPDVDALARMPNRSQMLSQLAGGLSAGPQKLVGLFAAPGRNLVGLMNALKEKRDQGTPPAAEAEEAPQPA